MDTIHNFILSFLAFTHSHIFYMYWLPVVLTAFGYVRKTKDEYDKDIEEREESDKRKQTYYPTLKLGTVIGRLVVSFIPFVNIFHAIKSVWFLGEDIIELCKKWLDIPLVPKRPK